MKLLQWFLLSASLLFAQEYVTCDFRGQLGNQMFLIAAAVGYALDHGYEVTFPTALQALNGKRNCQHVLRRLPMHLIPEKVSFFHYEDVHSNIYTPIPYRAGQSIRIDGHFESEKYFERHRQAIKELFAPESGVVEQIREKYAAILAEPTVAIHVRTFIPDGRNPLKSGIGGARWSYFTTAIHHFPAHFHVVVFSDDVEWTKRNFPVHSLWDRKVTFIEGNPDYIDFYFMSLCDHQIVSPESTFSWWAAWLNQNPNKTVIVADTWNELSANDTIPKGWLKLSKNPPHVLRTQQ